jgi:sulfoxide reductase heme-binding subunit YedZ
VISGLCAWVLYVTRPYPDVISRLSFATAYPALALLALTLAVGPWRILQGKPTVLSLDLRRDIGIWAGIVGVLHACVGQFVHLRGRLWLYYIYEDWRDRRLPVRHDLFGAANFTGLAAALVLLVLLAMSNDASLRSLGAPA